MIFNRSVHLVDQLKKKKKRVVSPKNIESFNVQGMEYATQKANSEPLTHPGHDSSEKLDLGLLPKDLSPLIQEPFLSPRSCKD